MLLDKYMVAQQRTESKTRRRMSDGGKEKMRNMMSWKESKRLTIVDVVVPPPTVEVGVRFKQRHAEEISPAANLSSGAGTLRTSRPCTVATGLAVRRAIFLGMMTTEPVAIVVVTSVTGPGRVRVLRCDLCVSEAEHFLDCVLPELYPSAFHGRFPEV
jgi:hypothetical protein